ncbi:alpha-glucosidase isoform X2 [Athalia rosae]|uniref:alpha-glucosidase isoform X2 n=1 Tax=Athalia rosae TaxID=37344 RepID=UPI00203457FD|nr:alpha-glucosidase isoform X2 [Athalia rosae]
MESGKLNIDTGDVKAPTEPVATYKPIPENDVLLTDKESVKEEEAKMAKQNGDADIDDGAQELMLKDTGRINSNKDATEVKFISENGDAKIDIETVKQTLTGMGKEELMKFANDPFWIRLRWFMFIAFWLLWAGMLAGAIAIIVMAPKCSAPEPKKLWEESPIVTINPAVTLGNLTELNKILTELKAKHVRVISLENIMPTSLSGHTVEFRNIEPSLGNLKDFKELVETATKQEQEIILEVDPNHTSDEHIWFKDSVKSIEPYAKYYVWSKGKIDSEGKRSPPNNWLSIYGGTAWEWHPERQEYYLHQFNKTQPDLNYENPDVVKEFSDILMHWLKLGVTGFRLANTQYLVEKLSSGNEAATAQPADSESYQSLNHVYTRDVIENGVVLRQWRQIVSNNTNDNGLFMLKETIRNDTLAVFNDKVKLVDLPQKSQFLSNADSNISATALRLGVDNSLKSAGAWPAWDLNNVERPLHERMPDQVAESLTLMTLLLPGTPILSLAQTKYPGDAFEILTKERSVSAFLYGETKTDIVNGTVFVYTRLKSGNPGYLVAYQSGDQSAIVDFSNIPQVSEQVRVVALSSNYHEKDIAVKSTPPSNSVPISPKSTMVVTFVPKA